MGVTDEDARALLHAVHDSWVASLTARGTFERAVRDAHSAGVPLSRIAAASGLSKARVHQLVQAPASPS